jgi:Leucine-rich repeat (LRR) protein
MNDNPERAIVRLPESRLEKSASAANRIVAAMIDETLVLARSEALSLCHQANARFTIGSYEWCEPDYRQILAWAKALALDPEIVIERLLDDRSIRERPSRFPSWAGTRFEDGKIIALHWDLDHLPLEHFVWINGVDLLFLSFSAHSFDHGGTGKIVKTLQLPFPNLHSVSCGNLGLRELDLTRVGKLEVLECCRTHIAHLDLSCVPLLKALDCSETSVSELDLSHTPHLADLNCELTKVSALNLSRTPNLAGLICGDTEISELDLSEQPSLKQLICGRTNISFLNLCSAPRLTYLDCRETPIEELDLTAVPHLDLLWCSCTRIIELDLSQVSQLTSLDCDFDMALDLSDVPKLKYLNWQCLTIESEEPALSGVPNLRELGFIGAQGASITRLDLSAVPKLERLSLQVNCKLVTLDLSAVPNLTELFCSHTSITELDIRPLTGLKILYYDVSQTRLLQRSDQNFKR